MGNLSNKTTEMGELDRRELGDTGESRALRLAEIGTVDWRRCSLLVGPLIAGGDGKRLQLEAFELMLLSEVLRRKIPVVKDGKIVDWTNTIAETSPKLAELADWAEGVAIWLAQQENT
jgi:hypothetical protein